MSNGDTRSRFQRLPGFAQTGIEFIGGISDPAGLFTTPPDEAGEERDRLREQLRSELADTGARAAARESAIGTEREELLGFLAPLRSGERQSAGELAAARAGEQARLDIAGQAAGARGLGARQATIQGQRASAAVGREEAAQRAQAAARAQEQFTQQETQARLQLLNQRLQAQGLTAEERLRILQVQAGLLAPEGEPVSPLERIGSFTGSVAPLVAGG